MKEMKQILVLVFSLALLISQVPCAYGEIYLIKDNGQLASLSVTSAENGDSLDVEYSKDCAVEDSISDSKSVEEQQGESIDTKKINENTIDDDHSLIQLNNTEQTGETIDDKVDAGIVGERKLDIANEGSDEAVLASSTADVVSANDLKDGYYHISSKLNANLRLDVSGGSFGNAANIGLWTINECGAQIWYVQSTEDGYYTLKASCSGKMLDVSGSSNSEGANVNQWQSNGSDCQKWKIEMMDDGNYRLTAKHSGLVLDVAGANASAGANVWQWPNNDNMCQRWSFVPIYMPNEGLYTIGTALNSGLSLDVAGGETDSGVNVQLWQTNNAAAQRFRLSRNTDGTWSVECVGSNKMLDVCGLGKIAGTNVWQWQSNGLEGQKWDLIPAGGDTYFFTSACNGLFMDVSGGTAFNGTNIQMYDENRCDAQRFSLEGVSRSIDDGLYVLTGSADSNQTLDVSGGSLENGGNVNVWSFNGQTCQKWLTIYDSATGYYSLKSVNSGKMLDVSGSGWANGTNVWQWTNNGLFCQKWDIAPSENGTYTITSACNGLMLDLNGNVLSNGTNIQCWSPSNAAGQRWRFEPSTVLADGDYIIKNAFLTDMVLDVENAGSADPTNVQLAASSNLDSQLWVLQSTRDGYFTLMTVCSGKMLDVSGAGYLDGTNANTWSQNNEDCQKWSVVENSDGTFSLVAKHSGQFLDASENIQANGLRNAQMWHRDSSRWQNWNFCFTGTANLLSKTGTLNGIDISSWQAGIDLSKVDYDFAIVKATEGSYYTNPYYISWADTILSQGKLLGFYHFASGEGDAVGEAMYFVNSVKGYIGRAVFILDWEADALDCGVSYAKTFLDTVYRLTGVRPFIYMSKGITRQFDWTSVAVYYPLWMAQYANYENMSYQKDPWTDGCNTGAWAAPAMFQYTSSGRVDGYMNNLDLNIFYGARPLWNVYASMR